MDTLIYKFFVYTALFGGVYTIIVNTLQGLSKYKLVIITVLSGLITNAILDEEYVIDICKKLGIKCFVQRIDIKHIASNQKMSLEMAGRK